MGLDIIAIPGDTPVEVVAAIIADEAAIGMVNAKTSAVQEAFRQRPHHAGERLFPQNVYRPGRAHPRAAAKPQKLTFPTQ